MSVREDNEYSNYKFPGLTEKSVWSNTLEVITIR